MSLFQGQYQLLYRCVTHYCKQATGDVHDKGKPIWENENFQKVGKNIKGDEGNFFEF